MALAERIKDILAVYEKHGWTLRRVLLTAQSMQLLTGVLEELFGTAEISEFEKDAVWFSRPNKDGEAWEIRSLAETPYALIDVFGPDQDEIERDAIRRNMEQRLLAANPKKAHTGH